jgi:glycine/D-amino acid oxidase-like deaminating enzyme
LRKEGRIMPTLLVVGGGLFGSLAAAWARRHGIETVVFEAGREGAASVAAAGLFHERWTGKKLRPHYVRALALLDALYDVRTLWFTDDDGRREQLHCVSPALICDPAPCRLHVDRVGDGWLEADGRRYNGWVYIAAGVWSGTLVPDLEVYGKAGAAFHFSGERPARLRALAPGKQAIAFVRDAGATYFSDGTAERVYTAAHDQQTLQHAHALGLTDAPCARTCGWRPYVPGGPVFRRLANRTWLATGGRKLGTILGASFARQLVEEELHSS